MGITEKQIWLALHKELSSQPEVIKKLCEAFGHDITCIVGFDDRQLTDLVGRAAEKVALAIGKVDDVRAEAEELELNDVHIIPFTDERYPSNLKVLQDFPPLLYARGNLALFNKAAIGICGSRNATQWGLIFSKKFGAFAAEYDVVVASGYANGVDTAAHIGALNADGETIVVLAEGIKHFRIKRDYRDISDFFERSLVVSQFYPNHIWLASRAMTRNEVICGLSQALMIVEASEKGGTIAAGRECIKQGKPTLVVVNSREPQNTAPGNQRLISEGGSPLRSTEEVKAVLEQISQGNEVSRASAATPSEESVQMSFA